MSRINPDLLRPAEVDVLLGDATKARERLGWAPSVTLEEMMAKWSTPTSRAIARGSAADERAMTPRRILVTGAIAAVLSVSTIFEATSRRRNSLLSFDLVAIWHDDI